MVLFESLEFFVGNYLLELKLYFFSDLKSTCFNQRSLLFDWRIGTALLLFLEFFGLSLAIIFLLFFSFLFFFLLLQSEQECFRALFAIEVHFLFTFLSFILYLDLTQSQLLCLDCDPIEDDILARLYVVFFLDFFD